MDQIRYHVSMYYIYMYIGPTMSGIYYITYLQSVVGNIEKVNYSLLISSGHNLSLGAESSSSLICISEGQRCSENV